MKQTDIIGVVSLGCSKNLVDTENMLGLLEAAGFSFTDDPAKANILIVNTCGFIEPAKAESINTILEMAAYKKQGVCHTLVMTGCLSQRYKKDLEAELPEVDIFLGVREYERLPGLLMKREWQGCEHFTRRLTTPGYSAYLRIADGCDNRCAYCAIPLIRGSLFSVPMEKLLDEGKRLVDEGVSELTLIAQDTSGYGVDLYGKPMLLPLMEKLSALGGLKWLRVLYTYPDTVTKELIAGIAGNEKVCNYLDMPLQHIDDVILKRMKRRGGSAHIKGILDYIRTHAPDFMLRTTMMVGFPGETDAQFETLLRFIQEYPFDRLGAFAFSPEEDTAAAALPEQLVETLKQERLHRLMQAQQEISLMRNERRVGQTLEVLIEGVSEGRAYGRSYAEAPDVDGKIFIKNGAKYSAGEYIKARMISAKEYDLEGEAIL